MNIGVIIHSLTGNTLQVAQRLVDELISRGHSAVLDRVTAVNEEPTATSGIVLESKPELDKFDLVIFGAPVRAFALSPVMKLYISELSTLSDKKVSCFVTEHFPKKWMGGTRAIKIMKNLCLEKGAHLLKTGIINWTSKAREAQIEALVKDLSVID